jgi:hypothetical protein
VSAFGRTLDWARRCSLAALSLLDLSSACSAADERRWRVFEQTDGALLAPSSSDDATDDVGSPSFRCQSHSGTIVVEGTATQGLRNAVADLIQSNGYPQVELIPASSLGSTLLTVSYSEGSGVWEYSFSLEVAEPAFDAFKRSGRLAFKIGSAVVREEFKAGLDSIAKFQAICKRPK